MASRSNVLLLASSLVLTCLLLFCLPSAAAPIQLGPKACNIKWQKTNFAYKRQVVALKKGTTCTFEWSDTLQHCLNIAKMPGGVVLKGNTFAKQGFKQFYTFKDAGKYNVKCCTHLSDMRFTVIVA